MRRLVLVTSTAALLLLAFATPVAADTAPTPREAFTSVGFDASSSECGRTTCTDTFIYTESVTTRSGDSYSFLCVDTFTFNRRTGLLLSEGHGCTDTANVTVADDLSSATLAPTTITLCGGRRCDEVTVSAELTASGGTSTFTSRFTENDGTCRFSYTSRGERRFAEGTITLDGDTSSAFGSIFTSDTTVTTRCR